MDPALRQVLVFRILVPVAATALMLGVARKRGLPLRDTFAWRLPRPVLWLLWLPGWAVVVGVEEWISRALALDPPSDWSGRGVGVLALTGLGMVLVAPLSEELIFRGLLYSQLERLRWGATGAVIGSALAFGAVHFQYSLATMAMVAVDGLIFALARRHTRSVPLCFAMHAMGNLYAYVQRLPTS